MKEWRVRSSKKEYTVLIDRFSFFKEDGDRWQFFKDDLNSFFSNKSSSGSIQILEDKHLLNKNDFQFIELQLDEKLVTDSSSITQAFKKEFLEILEFSPFYQNLVQSWDELKEEVDFLNEVNPSKYIKFELSNFKKEFISMQMRLLSEDIYSLNKVERSLFQLELLTQKNKDRQIIIGITIPIKYFSYEEYNEFIKQLQELKTGFLYFIFSDHCRDYTQNVLIKERVVNLLDCFKIKNSLKEIIPTNWNQHTFEKMSNLYISLVGNFLETPPFISLLSVDNLEDFIYLYSIFLLTKTSIIVDTTGISNSIQSYFDSLLEYKV